VSEGRLRLRVVTPTRVVVDTEADSVTVPAALGALGILPGHAPLLATLRIGELSYSSGTREHYLAVQNGFVEVTADSGAPGGGGVVTVLADVAELPSEIDTDAAHAQKTAAEAALKSAGGRDFDREQALLEGAVTRIAVAKRG